MKSSLTGLSVLSVMFGFLLPAQGADDVTQPACFGWFRRDPPPPPRQAYYVAPVAVAQAPCCPQQQVYSPPPTCCPQTTCTKQYTVQSYYQAVTTYQTQTYYEPVTTYQTSQYYEPVVTYRTSSYYCPNTCSYQTVQVPETGYQLKTKSCPVQSYVAKCQQVPVTTYQKAYYYQPQTVCTSAPPAPCCPTAAAPVVAAPQAPCCQQAGTAPTGPPQVTATPGQNWQTPPPPIVETPNDKYYKEMPRKDGNGNGGMSWQPVSPPPPAPVVPAPAAPLAQTVKLDRIVFGDDSTVEGEVIRADKTPRANVKVLFVNANQSNQRQTVTTTQAGRFQVTLAAGGWLVYIYSIDGDAVFHSRIEVSDEQSTGRIVLINR